MNNCSCNKKYLGEGCIKLPSEFGSYFLVLNLFKELDTEEKRLIALLNLGLDENLNKISKLIPTDTSEENKLINQEQLTQAVLNEASERENAIRELDSKIPVFTNEQLETLNSGITNRDKAKLDNAVEHINIANYLIVGTLMPNGAFYNYNNFPISSRGLAVLDVDLDITGGLPGDVTECIVFCRYDKEQESIYGTEYYAFTVELNGLLYVKSWLHNIAPQYIKNAFGEYSNATTTNDGLMSKEDKQKIDELPKDKLDGLTEKITIPEGTNDLYVDNYDDKVQIDADYLIQNAKHDVSISSRDGSVEIKSFDDLTLSVDEGNCIIMNIDDGGSITINIGETQLALDEYKLLKLISLLNNN